MIEFNLEAKREQEEEETLRREAMKEFLASLHAKKTIQQKAAEIQMEQMSFEIKQAAAQHYYTNTTWVVMDDIL